MTRDPLPKHLCPGDLRPHPRLNEIEGYLPAPSAAGSFATGPEGDSEKPPASTSSEVQTSPGDWAGPGAQAGTSRADSSEADSSEADSSESPTPESLGPKSSSTDEPMTAEELVEKAIEEGPAVVFDHIEVLARTTEAKYQKARARLKAETDVNLNALASARREASGRLAERQKKQKRRELEREDVPFIQVDANRPSREMVDEACSALEAFNDPPKVFRRGEEMVRVSGPEDSREGDRPVFKALEKAGFDDLLSRSANFAKETEEGFEHTDLSRRLASRVQARVDIPRLKSVSQVPLLRPDGSVLRDPGYDEETQVLYQPDPEIDVPPVPRAPTSADVQQAAEMLKEPFVDFPFVDQASRANLLAAVLTPILRPLLDGANVPLVIFDATKQGTGKTLLTDVVGLISAGGEPAKMSAPTSEPEWRKQITAQLRKGRPLVAIDNVKGRISSSALERALTAERYGDRLLGQSKQLDLPADVLWIATGNNLRPEGEMTRRAVLVRMDAETVRPWERSGFEHPNLRKWVESNRGELVAAGLTLVRAWDNEGRPTAGSSLGSFERWAEVVGGVLGQAGIEGFLDNLDEFYETAGREESQWSRLLKGIHRWAQGKEEQIHEGDSQEASQTNAVQGPAVFTAKELAQDLNAAQEPAGDNPLSDELGTIRDALPDELRSQLHSGEPIARGLGKRLGNRKGTRFPGGWHVQREGRGRRGTRWAVCQDAPEGREAPKGRDVPTGTDSFSNGTPSNEAFTGSGSPTKGALSDDSSSGASPAETSPENAPSGDRPPTRGDGVGPKPKAPGTRAT